MRARARNVLVTWRGRLSIRTMYPYATIAITPSDSRPVLTVCVGHEQGTSRAGALRDSGKGKRQGLFVTGAGRARHEPRMFLEGRRGQARHAQCGAATARRVALWQTWT
jgi:hypothetical protein